MARLAYPDPDALPDRVRDALDRVPPLNVFRMVAHAETAFRPWLAFGGALLSSLQLDPVVRELVILRVARLSDAEYEWVQHEPIALAVGANREQVTAVDRGALDDKSLGEGERAALRFATEVVRDVRASDEALAALAGAGFSQREVVELLLVVGQYMMVARVAETAGIELDDPADVVRSSSRGGSGR